MTVPQNSPVGRGAEGRDRLARALREGRARAAISGVRAGRAAGMSQSKISKIERGLLLPSVDDVAALCRVYELPADKRAELLAQAEALREEASSRVIMARGVSQFQRRATRMEAAASLVRSFEPALVLGALQTREYARCVFDDPRDKVSEEEAAASVEARQERHRALTEGTTRYELIMPEGALRWQVGSASIMVDQVEEIAAIAARGGNAVVGLVPWTTPVHVFPGHAFDIYDEDAVVVATETATATLTGAADIATYVELFGELEKLACFGEEAVGHLERITGEYRSLARR
ncbi:Scr1 family TA system antitoxin-like transcriptional regulator [Nocardiopsis dassonvillei]|uniref:Scr1 family TA system antitoxin-like transcriptional regulator n=1 Tax=Nocardiopsis dassonvillei TaxID=2014 RepID=UPI0033D649D1